MGRAYRHIFDNFVALIPPERIALHSLSSLSLSFPFTGSRGSPDPDDISMLLSEREEVPPRLLDREFMLLISREGVCLLLLIGRARRLCSNVSCVWSRFSQIHSFFFP